MFQVRIHGRGGQGVVTAAELLSVAAFLEGRHAQAIPSFGSERMGAPVVAFCRIDVKQIRRHDPVAEADAVVVQDPTLLHEIDLFGGLNDVGFVLINSERSIHDLGLDDLAARLPAGHLVICPAGEIARRATGRPLPNAALLGAVSSLTGCVGLESVCAAIGRRLAGELGTANIRAAREAAALVGEGIGERADA